jgi:hypothetical protein
VDLITGLPIHPLINHGVAVLVPLTAIGALLVIFIPKHALPNHSAEEQQMSFHGR